MRASVGVKFVPKKQQKGEVIEGKEWLILLLPYPVSLLVVFFAPFAPCSRAAHARLTLPRVNKRSRKDF